MAEDMSNIKCGCGFSATGPDQKINNEAFENHSCLGDGEAQAANWYNALFSWGGAVTVFVIGWVIVKIVEAAK